MSPLSFYYRAGDQAMVARGHALIAAGKLACLVLAGGEGSRLGWEGPKGTYPILEGKSLFAILAEKVVGKGVPLAIMTSPGNDEATRTFFQEMGNFGLKGDDLSFFQQGELPLLDHDKRPTDLMAADGNGYCLKYLIESGIYEKWKRRGIEHVHIVLIDNPLADPCDAELLGVHVENHLDWTLKCAEREDPQEKAGIVVEEGGKLRIVEYTELPEDVGPEYFLINTGMYCLKLDLIERLTFDLPLHLARKRRGEHWYFKQEAFIFDLLSQVEHAGAILCDRARIFAPLKDKDSVESVRGSLIRNG